MRRIASADRSDSPWTQRDVARSVGLFALALIVLAICWYGASGEADFRHQIVWIGAGTGAIVIAAVGLGGWLLAGIREVHIEMYQVSETFRVTVLGLSPTTAEAVDDLDDLDDLDQLREGDRPGTAAAVRSYVIGLGMTRVHTADCLLVRGKATTPVSTAEIAARELGYCEVCCV